MYLDRRILACFSGAVRRTLGLFLHIILDRGLDCLFGKHAAVDLLRRQAFQRLFKLHDELAPGPYRRLTMRSAVLELMLALIEAAQTPEETAVEGGRIAALISVLGIVWNRLNTSMICFNWRMYQEIPHWKEVWVTVTIFALYFIVYRFILYRLPILYQWRGER